MSAHKVIFSHTSGRAESVGANCKCGWTGFLNTYSNGGITKTKKSLYGMHKWTVTKTEVGA
jgi:peptide methionine sulfoxide reductase MsrB